MGFRLNAIFITGQALVSNEEILNKIGYSDFQKIDGTVDFYGTNKQRDSFFIGSVGSCKLICNGKLADQLIFEENEKNPLLNFKESEIAAIIWDETSGIYGFCLIQNGEIVRNVISLDGEKPDEGIGNPVQEELEINGEELFSLEEREEIIKYEGEEGLRHGIENSIICEATNNLAKRYIGYKLMEINKRIELTKYESLEQKNIIF